MDNILTSFTMSSDALLSAILILSAFLSLALLISLMTIYKKAGKPAISAIVPIWNIISLLQIVEKPMWYILLMMIPVVNIVIMIQVYIALAKKFGKGSGFAIGIIFLPVIFIPLLSFSTYEGIKKEEIKEEAYNPFNENNVDQVMPTTPINDVNFEVSTAPTIESANVEPIVGNTSVQQIEEVHDNVANPEALAPQMDLENQNSEVVVNPENNYPDLQFDDNNNSTASNNNNNNNNNNNVMSIEPPENIPEINEADGLLPEQNIASPMEQTVVLDNLNDNNANSVIEPVKKDSVEMKNIAFGSSPVIESVPVSEHTSNVSIVSNEPVVSSESTSNEILDVNSTSNNLETIEVTSNTNLTEQPVLDNSNASDDANIELPEKASKTCPACGVSLAEDTKFCIACGTQL